MGIAWVGHVEEINGRDEYIIDRQGMTRQEIVAAFPPHWNSLRFGMQFNRTELIKAIILEAYQEAQGGFEREPRNVRGFWYERLMYTLRTIMQDDGPQSSIDGAINQAWGDLVESGAVTYSGMAIRSAKSKQYHVAVNPDSPYPTSVVLVEKEDFFEPLFDIADTYEIAFVATGGQNSRCAAMEYAEQLRRLGIDVGQPFTVYSFCDFDPEGWNIPLSFIEHLSIKIPGPIALVRLGLLREHISESILRGQATPYQPEARTKAAIKAAATKYARFVDETGGIFMPHTGEPARVEIDIYNGAQIRERILAGLAERIDGFQYQVRVLKAALPDHYASARESLEAEIREQVAGAYEDYYDAIDEEQAGIDRQRAECTRDEQRRLSELHAEVARLERIIEEATPHLDAQYLALHGLRDQIEGVEEHVADTLVWQTLYSPDVPCLEDIIREIDANGGWRPWAHQVGVETIDSQALTQAAREHRRFRYSPKLREIVNIREWLSECLRDAAPDFEDIEIPTPTETPEELIAERLQNVDGSDGY